MNNAVRNELHFVFILIWYTYQKAKYYNKVVPYIVYPLQNCRGIRSDSHPEIVEAYEKLRRISETENGKTKNSRKNREFFGVKSKSIHHLSAVGGIRTHVPQGAS